MAPDVIGSSLEPIEARRRVVLEAKIPKELVDIAKQVGTPAPKRTIAPHQADKIFKMKKRLTSP